MANSEHLEKLKEGVYIWNKWREENPDIKPDLSLANLRDANLKNANLYGADLRNADLRDANLRNANLYGADLRNANLYGANLRNADLRNADLRDANLNSTNLYSVKINEETKLDDKWRLVWEIVNQGAEGQNLRSDDLSFANLIGANLIGANLIGANLIGANLIGANLRSANLEEANLEEANLEEANLEEANLEEANLEEANLEEANLEEANLEEANLIGADLNGASLREANLIGADLNGANLIGAKLIGAKLYRANLSSADLRGAKLYRANLRGANLSSANLWKADLSSANLWEADLSSANLWGANLWEAKLYRADLSSAQLWGAKLSSANLNGAQLYRANLSSADLNGADLNGADLSGVTINENTKLDDKWRLVWEIVNQGAKDRNLRYADLNGANLTGANLTGAKLSSANLTGAKLSSANLEGVALQAVQALATNFSNANFTGACIEDWNINSETKLDGVICDYIYLKENKQERRPSDPNKNFAPGEFTKLFQKIQETVDLIFSDGIDWKAFLPTLQDLQVKYENEDLSIAAIEKKPDGAFVVRLNVSPFADKGEIESQAKQWYEEKLKLLEAQYYQQLQAKDNEIKIYKQQSADILELAKLAASRPITVEAKAVAEKNVEVEMNVSGGQVTGMQGKGTMNINASGETKTLAEAAAEIQKLLKQLEETNPTATVEQQEAFVNLAVSPTLKARFASALQAGWKEAVKELLDNPYLNVGVAILEGWQDAE